MSRLASGTAAGPDADRLVRQWLSANVDQSMVGPPLVEQGGLDPIAHHVVTRPADDVLEQDRDRRRSARRRRRRDGWRPHRRWAAIANWEPSPGTTLDHLTVWAVLRGMRHIGEQVLAQL